MLLTDVSSTARCPRYLAEGNQRLDLLNTGPEAQYRQYPHAWIGLPSENDIRRVVQEKPSKSKEQVVQYFLNKTGYKLGVREKLQEVLDRKTDPQKETAQWIPEGRSQ